MARTIKHEQRAEKRNEILNAAQRLMYTKGYERMTIQDILADLRISSGAFYHYFDSKPAILEAFIERMRVETERPLLPIIAHPRLSAVEKLNGFFATLDRLRLDQQGPVVEMLRVWYTDENAIVRQKVDQAVFEQRAPLLNAIVRQGIREGVFTIGHPEHSGAVILSLLQGMGNTHAQLLLSLAQRGAQICSDQIIATHAAYMEAIERTLGAPANSLDRADAADVARWIAAIGGDQAGATGSPGGES